MSMHSEWTAAKAKAKRVNNNKEIKFKKDLGLGAALDKLEAAEKVHDKKNDVGPEWAKATDAWVAAAKAAGKIAVTYQQQLESLVINDVAKRELDNHLVFQVLSKTTAVSKEGTRLEPMLKKHRKA